MKVLSLFSGIGAFEKALENLNIDFDLVNYCEIDKYASKSYSLIHNVDESKNLWDVEKVDTSKLPNDIDLITYGFPCQNISLAGKQNGFFDVENGGKTPSGLFFDALKIIKYTKPKIAIAENVKSLTSKKFKNEFDIVLSSLEQVGYNNYWKVLNAKDYGIPQNRERVFIVSIRKDIDNGSFKFPKPFELNLRLKDIMLEDVDDKFYIKNAILNVTNSENQLGYLSGSSYDKSYDMLKRVYKQDGISPTLTTCQGGNTEVKVGIIRVGKTKSGGQKSEIISDKGISSCLAASDYKQPKQIKTDSVVRKLTPNEYFRLMGFDDEVFKKAHSVNSNSQLYKQAGNSIVVNVLMELFKKIYL